MFFLAICRDDWSSPRYPLRRHAKRKSFSFGWAGGRVGPPHREHVLSSPFYMTSVLPPNRSTNPALVTPFVLEIHVSFVSFFFHERALDPPPCRDPTSRSPSGYVSSNFFSVASHCRRTCATFLPPTGVSFSLSRRPASQPASTTLNKTPKPNHTSKIFFSPPCQPPSSTFFPIDLSVTMILFPLPCRRAEVGGSADLKNRRPNSLL